MAVAGIKEFFFLSGSIIALVAGGFLVTYDYDYIYILSFWKSIGKTAFYIGLVFSLAEFVAGITGYKAKSIENKIGEKGVLKKYCCCLFFA